MTTPIPMILFCPVCHLQHIDEVDEVTNPGWENPPHTSHKCLNCGVVWRPAMVETEGVRILPYHGKSDTWPSIGRRSGARKKSPQEWLEDARRNAVVNRKPNPVPFPERD